MTEFRRLPITGATTPVLQGSLKSSWTYFIAAKLRNVAVEIIQHFARNSFNQVSIGRTALWLTHFQLGCSSLLTSPSPRALEQFGFLSLRTHHCHKTSAGSVKSVADVYSRDQRNVSV